MLLAPSSSPSPEGLPFTTSPPPQQSPPVVQPPLAAPLVSPPFPPTNSASPVVSPPLLTPPLAPISIPKTPPPFLPVASPPPAVIAVAPPQPPTPPVVTPPPPSAAANTISPVASPPHPPPPALVISSPPPPQTPVQTPQPPISLPLTSPLPSPTPPTPPSIILPPPATTAPSLPPPRPPTDPPPFSLESPPPPAGSHSVGVPDAPGSSQAFPLPAPPPPLPLAVGKGGLPTTQQGSDSPIGLIVSCIGVGILLFVVFALVCICCKSRRRKQKPLEDRRKQQCLVTKDDLCAAPIQHEQEKVAPPPGVHVITVPPTALPQPPLTNAEGNGQPVIAWESRLKIAIGSAKGIAYLHEDCSPTIIHRDIKAANILLDPRFEAKVSDFGLAKIFSDASSSITHVSTRVVGTFGYLAPEYALTGKLTDKSDVYSYGVMLLELITGRRPIIKKEFSINESLVDWTRPLLGRALEDDDFDALADPRLQGAYNKSEMACMVTCAAACIRQSAWLRPRMSQVVRALEGDLSLSYLDVGGRSWNSSMYTSSETPIQKARQYENMKKINTSMGSKNYGISGNSETTSEYGLNPSGSSSESQRTN
ncbi:Protein kinase domain - like 10 [Theobroma cacao]|nr:Protein kinase domain - like 10 [Theobroma cacao]